MAIATGLVFSGFRPKLCLHFIFPQSHYTYHPFHPYSFNHRYKIRSFILWSWSYVHKWPVSAWRFYPSNSLFKCRPGLLPMDR